MVFDSPQPDLRLYSYVSRFKFLQNKLKLPNSSQTPHFVQIVSYRLCTVRDDVEEMFLQVRAKNGEGVILREPNSPYEIGYSRYLYKHKGFQDAEGLVLEKLSDTKFLCKIKIPHTDEFSEIAMSLEDNFEGDTDEIENGVFVSFKYIKESPNDGLPMDPKIYSIRSDVQSWDQLAQSKRRPPTHKKIWKPPVNFQWTNRIHRRRFFDNMARDMNKDPLLPSSWYSITSQDIKSKGGSGLFYHFDNHISAILDAYPQIGIEPLYFYHIPNNFYKNIDNCKTFFEGYAKRNNFDPLVPDNWYSVFQSDISEVKGGNALLHNFKSYKDAIMNTYPFIGLQREKFLKITREQMEKHRIFFDNLANEKGLDPLFPVHWYSLRPEDVYSVQGGNAIKSGYGSFIKALMVLYPNIGLQANRFRARSKYKIEAVAAEEYDNK